MPRIRTIKPEFWADEALARLSREARLLFIGLISFSDDEGRLRGNVAYLSATIFPYDRDFDIGPGLDSLEDGGFIQRYEHDGQSFVFVANFLRHQKIEKPSKSQLPEPPSRAIAEHSPKPRRRVAVGMEGKGREEEGNGREQQQLRAPTADAARYAKDGQQLAGPDPWPADLLEQLRVPLKRGLPLADNDWADFIRTTAAKYPLQRRVNAGLVLLQRAETGETFGLGYLLTLIREGVEPRKSRQANGERQYTADEAEAFRRKHQPPAIPDKHETADERKNRLLARAEADLAAQKRGAS